jgi:hypothetical protein
MRRKLGSAEAITAAAHKLAIVYHFLKASEAYNETDFLRHDDDREKQMEMRLRKQAARLGFAITPIADHGAQLFLRSQLVAANPVLRSDHAPLLRERMDLGVTSPKSGYGKLAAWLPIMML